MLGAPYRPYLLSNLKPTPVRLLNYLANKLSRKLETDRAFFFPHRVDLEVTNLCNLRCQLCPTGIGDLPRPRQHLPYDEFRKAFDPVIKTLALVQLAGYGEPFLNKKVFDIIDYLKANGVYTDIYSNVLPLDTEGIQSLVRLRADRITISLDSMDAEHYYEYKRVKGYPQTLEKIREILSVRKAARSRFPLINLQYVVMKLNSEQLDPARRLAEELGVDRFSPKTANLRISSEDWRKKGLAAPLAGFHRTHDPSARYSCPWIWDGFIFFADGNMGPCCYDGLGEHVFGNGFTDGILGVWNGPKFRAFRKAFLKNPNHTALCAGCTVKFKV